MVLSKYYFTLIYLKPIQIRYQLWYRIRRFFRRLTWFKYPLQIKKNGHPISLIKYNEKNISFDNYMFTFLNLSKYFPNNIIDWNFKDYGKLWTYNLNYFDFLLQPELKLETGLILINAFLSNIEHNSIGLEPYPISLRGINWIKFISLNSFPDFRHSSFNIQLSDSLYAQYQILLDNLEFHLLGNHLLENGFSILFGAFYFRDQILYKVAEDILTKQLDEQILNDGGHFELSPMYHQILLDRLLDCINLMINNERFVNQEILLSFMSEKAKKMLLWLNCMTFSNGRIPLMNDSAQAIAPKSKDLFEYALRLGILWESSNNPIPQNSCITLLKDSGYRRFNRSNYECIIDIGPIGAKYQPGHAHADTFNFVLNVNNKPFIIDTGISSYSNHNTRTQERATMAHNTISIENKNSSAVWSLFRVGRRAFVNIQEDSTFLCSASHNGYKNYKITHQRSWQFSENNIIISDRLLGSNRSGTAYLYISTSSLPRIQRDIIIFDDIHICIENAISINLSNIQLPFEFNHFSMAVRIQITFKVFLNCTIHTSN